MPVRARCWLQWPRRARVGISRATGWRIPSHCRAVKSRPLPQTWSEPGLTCIGSAAVDAAAALGATVSPAAFAPASAIARIAAQRAVTPGLRPAPLYLQPADAAPPSDPPPVILN